MVTVRNLARQMAKEKMKEKRKLMEIRLGTVMKKDLLMETGNLMVIRIPMEIRLVIEKMKGRPMERVTKMGRPKPKDSQRRMEIQMEK
jgi:hypothetical protein